MFKTLIAAMRFSVHKIKIPIGSGISQDD